MLVGALTFSTALRFHLTPTVNQSIDLMTCLGIATRDTESSASTRSLSERRCHALESLLKEGICLEQVIS